MRSFDLARIQKQLYFVSVVAMFTLTKTNRYSLFK